MPRDYRVDHKRVLLRFLYDSGRVETGDVIDGLGWSRSNAANRMRILIERGYVETFEARGRKYAYGITEAGIRYLEDAEGKEAQFTSSTLKPDAVDTIEGPEPTENAKATGIWTHHGAPVLDSRSAKVKRLAELEEQRAALAEEIRELVRELYEEGNDP